MVTEDLSFWESLAKRGPAAEAALAAAKRELEPHVYREIATRYRHRDGFVLERVQRTSGELDWQPLVERGREDIQAYYDAINAKWRSVAGVCDLALGMPAAMCYLWRDTDGVDMRAFLLVKMAVIAILKSQLDAADYRAPRPVVVSARDAALKIRGYLPVVELGCENLAIFARLPPDAAAEGLPRRWRESTQRSSHPDVTNVYFRNSHGSFVVNSIFATNLVDYFVRTGEHFWTLRPNALTEITIDRPQVTIDKAFWPAPRPAPTLCLVPTSLRRRDAYSTEDDLDGCLPSAFLGRLAKAARDAATDRKAWWSKTHLASQLRDCKASKDERAVLTRFWTSADKHLRDGLDAKALASKLAALELDARKGFAKILAPNVSPYCTPVALATWLAKAAYDALPDKDKLTTLEDWVGKSELDGAVEACDLPTDEAVLVRMLWSDLDAIVQSSAARTTKEAAMKDALHAYRYDRPPWAVAQRRKARSLIDQALRGL